MAVPTPPRPLPRQFKKCKSATFTLGGTNYTIGKNFMHFVTLFYFIKKLHHWYSAFIFGCMLERLPSFNYVENL